ncbi:WD domain-containing protein [Sodiomyces alkalinus F11]|uniref:WD domain-containing protein n=1 Tax=Sodiomyces alkalinus (strain CBS 110278 / VKM F-3762 / F11) TaxID=1314773 RepID=A0A3N2Q6F2_SODAK|nr:WD domain-containing protein [Sodiomyces alkalinus F11]ROT42344.1 WD domain-containing protein [Sodiomyces alkalinus F11]
METSNPEHFFETDTQLAKRQLRAKKEENTFGDPIRISSKVLAVIPDPAQPYNSIFTAESGGRVSRINVETRSITAKYQGPTVPVTCVATGGPGNTLLFAGSWDKTIWSWDIGTRRPGRRYDGGHTDFVKAVVTARLGQRDLLISGGADKKIMVWDVATGRRLHTIQDPSATMMSLQSLAVDPVLSNADEVVLTSTSSDPFVRRWRIRQDGAELLPTEGPPSHRDQPPGAAERLAIEEHETSVYKALFDVAGDEVDLWTASADGTAKCLSRERNFTTDDVFEHGDFVKGLVVTDTWVATGGFSQDIKIWDRTSGKLAYILVGHFDEIADFALLRDPSGRQPDVLCSVGIDCTVRTWPLHKPALDAVVEKIRAAEESAQNGEEMKKESGDGDGLLTAEEEAELAALMED